MPDDLTAGQTSTSQLPWAAIPKFIPGSTNVQEYTQKLRFLSGLWPTEHLELLAPRAALLVEGTAFRKVSRIDPAKLKVKDTSGIALLVAAIGGAWGSTELEERYSILNVHSMARCRNRTRATTASSPAWRTILRNFWDARRL